MANFSPFSFLDQFAEKAVDVGKKVVSEIKESAQAFPFRQSLVGKGLQSLGNIVQGRPLKEGYPSNQQALIFPVGAGLSPEQSVRAEYITGATPKIIQPQGPYTPAGYGVSTQFGPGSYNPQTGQIELLQYSPSYQQATGLGYTSVIPGVTTPVTPPLPPPTPPYILPLSAPPIPPQQPVYNPETTLIGPRGELLTGYGGFGGTSAGQFGFGTGISGAPGGAQLLPGGLASSSRFAGGLPVIEEEEAKKRRTQAIQAYTVQPGDTLNKIANRLGIDPSQIGGFRSGDPNRIFPGETLQIQGGFASLGGVPTGQGVPQLTPVQAPGAGVQITDLGGGVGPAINLEAFQRNFGFKQPETLGGTPSPFLLNQGVVRTFNRIGQNVYETTGGQLNLIQPNQLQQFGFNVNNINQIRELQSQDISDAQKQMVNRIATQQGQPEPFPKPKAKAPPVTGADFTEQKVVDQETTTKGQYDQYSSTQLNYRKDTGQVNPNTLTPDLPSNGYNRYYKNINEQTGEWEIFDSETGNTLGPDIATNIGLNIADLNTIEGLSALGKVTDITYEQVFGFDSTKQIFSKNAELQKQADELAKLMKDMISKDPWSGQTVSQVRDSMNKELGLNTLYDERLENIKQMNEVKNSFDVLRGDIEDDPDFSKRSKVLRVDFVTNKTQRLLDTFVRERELIDQRITNAEKAVTTRMGDMVTQYNIYRNQVNDIEQAYNNLQTRIDKVSENAQQSLQFLASNPEAMKGATKAQLKQEIQFISNNGYLPMSMITRIGQNNDFKGKGVVELADGIYMYDSTGNLLKLGAAPVKTTTESPYSNIQFKDNGDGTFTAIGISKLTNQPVSLGTITAGRESKEFLSNQYSQWLQQHKFEYSNEQLRAVLGSVPGLNTLNLTENKPIFDLIDAFDRRFWKDDPAPTEKDPLVSFTQFTEKSNPPTTKTTGTQLYELNGVIYTKGSDGKYYPKQ